MRLFIHRLRNDASLRRIVFPVVAIVLASVVTGVALDAGLSNSGTAFERAMRLSSIGEYSEAEQLLWNLVRTEPVETSTLIAFIDNRAAMIEAVMLSATAGQVVTPGPVVSADEFANLLTRSDLSPDIATMGRFWSGVKLNWGDGNARSITALADRVPPVRQANHLLARAALDNDDLPEAAARFEKEGLAFPDEEEEDLARAIDIWIHLENWDEVRARIDDPRFSASVGPSERRDLAEHDKDWPTYLLWLWPASLSGARLWPIGLALLAGSLWFAIAASLGGASVRPQRLPLYAISFVLGVISIYPTLILITIEEQVFNLQFTGQLVADAIYFVFGVGLREELCKFLLFLPLLPLLRRRGSRIEALICGAMIGLGFAAEENINYFHRMDVSAALGRFLTANFLHMALTGLIGLAAYDADHPSRTDAFDLNTTFLLAVIIHGAYDFLLASPAVSEYSIFAMTVFVLLSQRFLREVLGSNATPPQGTLRLFIISITILTGASYVFATTLVGPWTAIQLIAVGVVGQAILIYMFVLELGGVRA